MPRITPLDRQWTELMALCANEATYRDDGTHPKLLKLVTERIDALAQEMGFSARRIASRDFRAERQGDHISRIIAD